MSIIERIYHIKQQILEAETASERTPGQVSILAVSKGHTSDDILQAYDAGLRDFGESYLQEAKIKITQLAKLAINWHYIGPIQSNKTRGIAELFSWVHSVSRHNIAWMLDNERPKSLPPLNVCLQVKFDEEESKAGVHPDLVAELAAHILNYPRLKLRGLMLVPKLFEQAEQQYLSFLRLTHLLQRVNQQLNITMDTLSMGMSHDFKAAIRAGSTMIRLGTAIFGKRQDTR